MHADGDGVIVHCFAGKDRTGIVSALLLSLAGVPDELIADDYAASDPGVEALSTPWFESARDETRAGDPAPGLDLAARDDARRAARGCTTAAGGADEYLRVGRRHGCSARRAARAARREA